MSKLHESTVPYVKKYLVKGILDAAISYPSNYPLLVDFDLPGQFRPPEMVMVGKVFNRIVRAKTMMGSGGHGWLHEEYTIEVVTDIFRPGESLKMEAMERAWQLNSLVESVVRDDPSLGGKVIVSRPDFTDDDARWEKDHKGWMYSVSNKIKVTAQI